MTNEQIRSTKQALNETHALIAKELRYQEKFQKQDYLASLRSHAEKLEQMLAENVEVPVYRFDEAR